MLSLIWRTIRDKRKPLLVYLLIAVGLIWLYVLTYPSVQATSQQVSEFAKILPPELKEAFGIDPRSFITFEGFIAGKHFSLVWPMMLIMIISGFAAATVAGEIEAGTIELLLSQPVSRIKIMLAKIATGIIINLIFVFISVVSVIPIASYYGISIPEKHFLLLAIVGFFFGLAVFGLAILPATLFSERGKSLFWATGIFLIMYVINIVALLKASLESLKFASLFYYFDYSGMLLEGKIGESSILIFLVIFLCFSIFSSFWFINRDVKN